MVEEEKKRERKEAGPSGVGLASRVLVLGSVGGHMGVAIEVSGVFLGRRVVGAS